ncbi:MAG TPA: Na+/H+ antiporter NhaC family protein [Balneolaceae bacterium]|nr:Na+/H+ antiporter NhaC family protein [Balneolaceae bacterium]
MNHRSGQPGRNFEMLAGFVMGMFLLIAAASPLKAQVTEPYQLNVPPVVLNDTPFEVVVSGKAVDSVSTYRLHIAEKTYPLVYHADSETLSAEVELSESGTAEITLTENTVVIAQTETRSIPGWLSILPPLIAIGLALVFKRVVPALFLGVWIGASIAVGLTLGGFWQGLLEAFGTYVLSAMATESHVSIILFSLMIGGMVGIIRKNGGTHGIVNKMIDWASNPTRGQVATNVLGIVIFFDDYANTLIVGNTMRSITDKLRISREKLAYIVDSTSAPVASLALVTTWIGFEVGLINDALATIGGLDLSGYSVFLESILYRFYPWLALFFVFAIAFTDREYGPMWKAEHRARTTGDVIGEDAQVDETAADGEELEPKPDKPVRAINAVIPVAVLVFGVLYFLYTTGLEAAGPGASIREIIGAADSYTALMWGSILSVIVAAVLSMAQRILTLEETVEAWYSGLKSMLFAMIVLVLAWALSSTTEVLHTAEFLGSVLSDALPPGLVPAIIFVLAALISFATGTSWGTMGILMPLTIPLTWSIMQANGIAEPEYYYILYNAVSAVLAGAVFGDHCSPISDTTILSSMASGCDHIAHVNTQLPYAVSVGVVGLLLGTVPTGFGFPWWLSMLICAPLLLGILWYFGKPVEAAPETEVAVKG